MLNGAIEDYLSIANILGMLYWVSHATQVSWTGVTGLCYLQDQLTLHMCVILSQTRKILKNVLEVFW